jgi:hypothetical protein
MDLRRLSFRLHRAWASALAMSIEQDPRAIERQIEAQARGEEPRDVASEAEAPQDKSLDVRISKGGGVRHHNAG